MDNSNSLLLALKVVTNWWWFFALTPLFVYLKRKKLANKIAFAIIGFISGYVIHIVTGYLFFRLREKIFTVVGANVALMPILVLFLRMSILYLVLSTIAKSFRSNEVENA